MESEQTSTRDVWLDYISKLNDRALNRQRAPGVITWAVAGVIAVLLTRVLAGFAHYHGKLDCGGSAPHYGDRHYRSDALCRISLYTPAVSGRGVRRSEVAITVGPSRTSYCLCVPFICISRSWRRQYHYLPSCS